MVIVNFLMVWWRIYKLPRQTQVRGQLETVDHDKEKQLAIILIHLNRLLLITCSFFLEPIKNGQLFQLIFMTKSHFFIGIRDSFVG